MTTAMITQRGTIRANHLVRAKFAEQSTCDGASYYPTKGHAVRAFDGMLQAFDLCLDRNDLDDFHGDEGRKVIDVHNENHVCVGRAVLSWYRMPSGRYEFNGYLA
jgi:hypothetical protein